MKKKIDVLTYMIWIAFGVFLLYSMSNVFMYYDDFGFASLSYGYVEPDVQGQNFTFSQLFHFLSQLYKIWSGRVVFFGMQILMLKNIWICRIAQSVSVLISFIALCRFSSETRLSAVAALFSVSLYGAFNYEMFRNGFFWFSASAIYVLPLAFFFSGCLILKKIENDNRNNPGYMVPGCFCFFLAGVSQEQTASTLVVFLLVLCFFDYIGNKKIKLFRLPFLATSLLGSGFLLLAPGNFNRFFQYDHGTSIPLLQKILQNLESMPQQYLNINDNLFFMLLFSFFICYIGHYLWIANKIKKYIYLAVFPSSFFFLLLPLFLVMHNILRIAIYASFYIYFIYAIYIITKYLLFIKDRYLTALFFGALFSQISVLLYAPDLVQRTGIIFYFALFALFIHAFTDIKATLPKERLLVWVLLPIVLLSTKNIADMTYGYFLNRKANIYNENLLRQASQDIKEGIETPEIVLMQMADARFAGDFPDYAFLWIREFYDIPSDVKIYNTTMDPTESIGIYYGFYTNENGLYKNEYGDYPIETWTNGDAYIALINKSANYLTLSLYYPENWPANSVTVTINNNESIKREMIPGETFIIEMGFINAQGIIYVHIKTEREFIPFNEGWSDDTRKLGVFVASLSLF